MSPAYAHVETSLALKADGSIPDLPAQFGRATLIVKGLGTAKPLVQLTIGASRTTLPPCIARLIRTRDLAHIYVSGSWYHDEHPGLPYYMELVFGDPGSDPRQPYNYGLWFMIDLHNARILYRGIKADISGLGGGKHPLKLRAGCEAIYETLPQPAAKNIAG